MGNAEYAAMLKRENPDLYYEVRGLVWRPMNPSRIRERVLRETGDERLASLAGCAAVYHLTGR